MHCSNMSRLLTVAIFLVTFVSVESSNFTKYTKLYWSRQGTVFMEMTHASAKQCAALCEQSGAEGSQECSGFHLDVHGQLCMLFTGIIPGIDWADVLNPRSDLIYRKGNSCPASLGYSIVQAGNSRFCLAVFDQSYLNYHMARKECNKHGGNLAQVDSKDKRDAILKVWLPHSTTATRLPLVGLNDIEEEGKFVSILTGKPSGYPIQWAKNEPSNSFTTEDCVNVLGDQSLLMFYDCVCSSAYPYICEIPM